MTYLSWGRCTSTPATQTEKHHDRARRYAAAVRHAAALRLPVGSGRGSLGCCRAEGFWACLTTLVLQTDCPGPITLTGTSPNGCACVARSHRVVLSRLAYWWAAYSTSLPGPRLRHRPLISLAQRVWLSRCEPGVPHRTTEHEPARDGQHYGRRTILPLVWRRSRVR